jgi:hypothetical protein
LQQVLHSLWDLLLFHFPSLFPWEMDLLQWILFPREQILHILGYWRAVKRDFWTPGDMNFSKLKYQPGFSLLLLTLKSKKLFEFMYSTRLALLILYQSFWETLQVKIFEFLFPFYDSLESKIFFVWKVIQEYSLTALTTNNWVLIDSLYHSFISGTSVSEFFNVSL